MSELKIRSIAFYLPQFHPIPENDQWWGKGFTEWTNVVKAKVLFKNYYQPHLPADLGFYDLRLEETRIAQAELAREHGIYGFCYYHYWFNGRRILERPFNEVLESGKPDFPFMLCWANENWTKIWDGGEKHILLKQAYSTEDDVKHINSLIPAFKDPRYIKIDNKPVFAVYKSSLLPDPKSTVRTWRNEAEKAGIELYLCRVEAGAQGGAEYFKDGFDAAIRFEPLSEKYLSYVKNLQWSHIRNKVSIWYLKYKFSSDEKRIIMLDKIKENIDYKDYVDYIRQVPRDNYKYFPCVTPMWDNSARRKTNYFLFRNSSPTKYKEWLEFEVKNFKPYSGNENLFFINAWNEWAEGNHLEPCQKWGRQYLEATKEVLVNL